MAKLAELGKQFPCTTQGVQIPVDDEDVEIYSGEVLEAWFEADRDINTSIAFDILVDVLRMKEQYPYFVLHYVKVETRKITVQYSLAPMGTTASPHLLVIAAVLLVIAFAGIIATIGLTIRWTRGYLWSPTGSAVITAKHTETQKGISGVRLSVDGKYVGKTDGGSVSAKGLVVGDHQFAGEPLEGFHDPAPVTALIELNKVTNVTIWYRPSDIPEPKTGDLNVYTSPVSGIVYVDGEEKGPAPIAIKDLTIGNHSVGFGSVEGYITPSPQTVTIVGGQTSTVTGTYTTEAPWIEKYLRIALIGVGAIFGGALIVPPAIRALRKEIAKGTERGKEAESVGQR
jgi:hypothetical protein